MNRTNVDTVKEASDIIAVIGDYVELHGAGKWFRGRCPFHNEKTPSFYVSPDRNRYKCFGCGKGGDVVTFIEEIENVSFPEALKLLADRAGILLTSYDDPASKHKAQLYDALLKSKNIYQQTLQKMPSVLSYLAARGVSPESIASFGIGFAIDDWQNVTKQLRNEFPADVLLDSGLAISGNKGIYDRFRSRLMFPLYDGTGKIVGFSGRLLQFPGRELQTEKPTSGKYVNSPESLVYHKSEILFGFYTAKQHIKQSGRVVIVEGQFDCVLSQQSGIGETVAISGTALTDSHATQLARFTDTAILALDGDAAGIKALSRSLGPLYAAGLSVLVAKLPKGIDPADMVAKNPEDWKKVLSDATDYIDVRLQLLADDGATSQQQESVIRADIYPLVRAMNNPIEQDRVVQKIAKVLSVSASAISRDISKDVPTVQTAVVSEARYTPKASELLVGIIGYATEEGLPLANQLWEVLGSDLPANNPAELANLLGIQYDDAVFVVSAEYANAGLETHGLAAARLVLREYLKQTRTELAHMLSSDPTNTEIASQHNRVVARIDQLSSEL